MPIHIFSLSVTSVITRNDPVWVHNGGNPELKQVAHLVTQDVFRDQEVDESVDDERTVRLSTMLSTNDDYDWFDGLIIAFNLVRYLDDGDVDISVRRSKRLKSHEFVI